MKTRLLFINFTQKETEKFSDFDVEMHRGYLSDADDYIKKSEEEIRKQIKFFVPLSIHEFKIIFINLNKNPEIDKEFQEKARPYPSDMPAEFNRFWFRGNGIIVFFLGDYHYPGLASLGAPDIVTQNITEIEKTILCPSDIEELFEKLKSEVRMPTNKYITIEKEETSLYKLLEDTYTLRTIYKNRAGRVLGCYLNKGTHDYDTYPEFFILPLFQNKELAIRGLLKELAKIYESFLPEFLTPDWKDSNKYYPIEVTSLEEKITRVTNDAKERIAVIEKDKETAKQKFKPLYNILCEKGDDILKPSIIDVLKNIFNLSVIDSDKERETVLAGEDIVIDYNGEKILAEIKGDNAQNPSTLHLGQLWKHLKFNKNINRGALILNYDLDTEPEERNLAYTGELEEQLKDIIFIDTRVLFDLAIAVIDFGMSVDEANKILWSEGRVTFDLKKWNYQKKP